MILFIQSKVVKGKDDVDKLHRVRCRRHQCRHSHQGPSVRVYDKYNFFVFFFCGPPPSMLPWAVGRLGNVFWRHYHVSSNVVLSNLVLSNVVSSNVVLSNMVLSNVVSSNVVLSNVVSSNVVWYNVFLSKVFWSNGSFV
jgi:hypothetical protein